MKGVWLSNLLPVLALNSHEKDRADIRLLEHIVVALQ